MALFARQGFEGTTTRQIAEMARVNEAIIFRHFPTKEDLYWAIIEQRCQTVGRRRMIQQTLETGDDDMAIFSSIAEAFLRRTRQDANITRLLLFTALERHELADEFFRKYVVETYETLAQYIRRRIAEGSFRNVDALLAARSFIGMVVYHFQVQEVFGWRKHQDFDAQHVARTLAEIWLKGMARDAVAAEPRDQGPAAAGEPTRAGKNGRNGAGKTVAESRKKSNGARKAAAQNGTS